MGLQMQHGETKMIGSQLPSYMFLAVRAITWKFKKQTVTAQSSTKVEYISLAEAAWEACWLRSLHEELTKNYLTVGTVNNITSQMRWEMDEAVAMQVIAASIPNSVFTNIKGKTNTQGVWDTLKALYEGRITMVLVKLSL
jgi:hypothetical protein